MARARAHTHIEISLNAYVTIIHSFERHVRAFCFVQSIFLLADYLMSAVSYRRHLRGHGITLGRGNGRRASIEHNGVEKLNRIKRSLRAINDNDDSSAARGGLPGSLGNR